MPSTSNPCGMSGAAASASPSDDPGAKAETFQVKLICRARPSLVDVLDGEHVLVRRRAEGERTNGEPLDGAGMPGLGVGAGKPFGEALDGPGHGNTVPLGHLDAKAEGWVA